VSGQVRDFRPAAYPQDEAIVPHGMSVIVSAPAVFRFTAEACPGRHREAARALGADVSGVDDRDAGVALAERIIGLMRGTQIPNGLAALGYTPADVDALTAAAFPQRRLFENSPREVSRGDLHHLFDTAMAYW
jgi:alcohol dehydrogenase class IV